MITMYCCTNTPLYIGGNNALLRSWYIIPARPAARRLESTWTHTPQSKRNSAAVPLGKNRQFWPLSNTHLDRPESQPNSTRLCRLLGKASNHPFHPCLLTLQWTEEKGKERGDLEVEAGGGGIGGLKLSVSWQIQPSLMISHLAWSSIVQSSNFLMPSAQHTHTQRHAHTYVCVHTHTHTRTCTHTHTRARMHTRGESQSEQDH